MHIINQKQTHLLQAAPFNTFFPPINRYLVHQRHKRENEDHNDGWSVPGPLSPHPHHAECGLSRPKKHLLSLSVPI